MSVQSLLASPEVHFSASYCYMSLCGVYCSISAIVSFIFAGFKVRVNMRLLQQPQFVVEDGHACGYTTFYHITIVNEMKHPIS